MPLILTVPNCFFVHFTADIQVNCTVKAKVIDKEGARVLHVENADGDVSWKKEIIQIDNLFPDKKASALSNILFL